MSSLLRVIPIVGAVTWLLGAVALARWLGPIEGLLLGAGLGLGGMLLGTNLGWRAWRIPGLPAPQLVRRESHLAAMVAAAMDGIIQIDAAQRIVLVNSAAEAMFGYTEMELIGQPLDMLIPEATRHRHEAYVDRFIQAGATSRHHGALPILYGQRHDGSFLPLEISLTTTITDQTRIMTAIVRDASDRLRQERDQQVLMSFTAALRGAATSADLIAAMVGQINDQFAVPHLALLLCDDLQGGWQIAYVRGAWEQLPAGAGQAIAQALDSAEEAPPALAIPGATVFGLALSAHHQRIGALYIGRERPLTAQEQRLLMALAEVGASALRRSQWSERLEQANVALREAYDATIAGWARALDLRDSETEDHSQRVADLTVALADRLGVPKAEIEHLRRGALLHDIGKMGVPDAILNKAGPLSDAEWKLMRQHPVDAYRILEPIAFLDPALDIPLSHHERWDGSGYPAGLRGEAIPLAARIFAVVDVWDALTNDRPYRAAWDGPRALAYLEEHAGGLFDPQVVRAFIEMMRG